MRIHGDRKGYQYLPGLILGPGLSLLFFHFGKAVSISGFPWYITISISFLLTFSLVCAFGLFFHEQSIGGALFLLGAYLPFLYNFSLYSGVLRIEGILPGLFIAAVLVRNFILINRFSTLAGYARVSSQIFFAWFAAYLFYLILDLAYPFLAEGLVNLLESESTAVKNLLIAFIALLALFYFTSLIRGIRASDVFIYGPKRSGKTLLLLALYSHFVDIFNGTHQEIVVSCNINKDKAEAREEKLRIESLLAEVENGNIPESTQRDEMAIYVLSGKKGPKPIEFTFIDYSGEYTADIDPKKYISAVQSFSEHFNNFNVNTVSRRIGTLSFLKLLKNEHAKELGEQFHNLILATMYKKLQSSGKIIFLIDGDHLLEYHKNGRKELTRLFGHYVRIMDLLGNDKSYAFVLTKTDKLKDLAEISEDSEEAGEIERDIYKMFSEIHTFQEIQNRARKVPVYFYTVSINATLPPRVVKGKELSEDEYRISQIFPWRVGELAKFGF